MGVTFFFFYDRWPTLKASHFFIDFSPWPFLGSLQQLHYSFQDELQIIFD